MRFRSGLFFAAAAAILCYSCRDKGGKDIDQGEIHYTIEYRGNMNSMPKEIMPRTLIVMFKENKILFDISSPIGNSGIINLSNPEDEIYDTYISLFTWRYYYAAEKGELHPGFEAMQGMEIRKTSKTSTICGFNCKGAEVTFPADRKKVYEIWYTDEINVRDPNVATPFAEIDGVLMSFFFLMGSAEMHFNAESVYKKEIHDKEFQRREKFIRVSKEDINQFIDKMLSI